MSRIGPWRQEPRRLERTGQQKHSAAVAGPSEATDSSLARKTLEIGLTAVIFLAPLFMGGRHPVGQFVLAAIALGTTTLWLAARSTGSRLVWRLSGAELLIVAGFGLLTTQMLTLPSALQSLLSPATEQLLPLWTEERAPWFQFGRWSTISVLPAATRSGMAMFAAYSAIFLIVVQYVRHTRDAERVLHWVAWGAVAMAALGLAQFLVGNGKFIWFYAHPTRTTAGMAKGAFSNENHFAHFLALGLGPLLWAFQRSVAGRAALLRGVLLFGLALVVLAGLLTFSRGGVCAMLWAAVMVVAGLSRLAGLGRGSWAALAAVGGVVGAALFMHGAQNLEAELGRLIQARSWAGLLSVRLDLWGAALRCVPKFFWLGSGVGSFAEVYPLEFSLPTSIEYTHAENGYLQVLLETGFVGLGLLLVGAAMTLRWCWRATRGAGGVAAKSAGVAVSASLATSLLHSWGDFVWYIPACLSLTIVQAAVACRLSQLADADRTRVTERFVTRRAWAAGAVVATAISGLLLKSLWGPALAAPAWDRYFAASLALDPLSVKSLSTIDKLTHELRAVVERQPTHGRAHLRLAALYLQRFELEQQTTDNAMTLSQIREAALASHFPSAGAQADWLRTAFGDNGRLLDLARRHARLGLRHSPFRGEGYLILSDLAFLENPTPSLHRDYLAQSLRIRPHGGGALAAVGNACLASGDCEQAFSFWRRAFHQDETQRRRIIEFLGRQISAKSLSEKMQPDLDGAAAIYAYYHAQGRAEDSQFSGRDYAERMEGEARHAKKSRALALWRAASDVYFSAGQTEDAERCLGVAVELAPSDFGLRRRWGDLLLAQQRYDEAIATLQWCRSRQPDDVQVRATLAAAQRKRLERRPPGGATSSNRLE